jgi:hypothetical protein
MMRSAMARIGWVCFVLVLVVTVPATLAQDSGAATEGSTGADEEAGPKLSPFVRATGGKAAASSEKVYTNDDLERLRGAGPASSQAPSPSRDGEPPADGAADTAEGSAKPPEAKSALDQLFECETLRQEHAQKVADAEQQVVAAKQRLADLERRLLAIKNPLLARPAAPEEGAEEWNSADGQQRVQQTESQIQAARDEIAQAERDLAELQRSSP